MLMFFNGLIYINDIVDKRVIDKTFNLCWRLKSFYDCTQHQHYCIIHVKGLSFFIIWEKYKSTVYLSAEILYYLAYSIHVLSKFYLYLSINLQHITFNCQIHNEAVIARVLQQCSRNLFS